MILERYAVLEQKECTPKEPNLLINISTNSNSHLKHSALVAVAIWHHPCDRVGVKNEGKGMLHLQIKEKNKEAVVLAVDGDLKGDAVQILAKEGKDQLKDTKCLVLDLTGVQFIDSAGIDLLQSWSGARLELRGGSFFIKALLKAHKLV